MISKRLLSYIPPKKHMFDYSPILRLGNIPPIPLSKTYKKLGCNYEKDLHLDNYEHLKIMIFDVSKKQQKLIDKLDSVVSAAICTAISFPISLFFLSK